MEWYMLKLNIKTYKNTMLVSQHVCWVILVAIVWPAGETKKRKRRQDSYCGKLTCAQTILVVWSLNFCT